MFLISVIILGRSVRVSERALARSSHSILCAYWPFRLAATHQKKEERTVLIKVSSIEMLTNQMK